MRSFKFTRRHMFQLAGVLLLIIIAIIMFVVGKQHALLLDNKTIEDNGTTYPAFSIVEIQINREEALELASRDRDRVDVMGQRHKVKITYLDKFYEEHVIEKRFHVTIGYGMVLISIPALAGDADQSVWLQEFIPPTAVAAPLPQEEQIVTEELIPTDI